MKYRIHLICLSNYSGYGAESIYRYQIVNLILHVNIIYIIILYGCIIISLLIAEWKITIQILTCLIWKYINILILDTVECGENKTKVLINWKIECVEYCLYQYQWISEADFLGDWILLWLNQL